MRNWLLGIGGVLLASSPLCVAAQEVVDPFEGVNSGEPDPSEILSEEVTIGGVEATGSAGAQPSGPIIQIERPITFAQQSQAMTIGAINIEGGGPVPKDRLAQSYEPFLGMEANKENLRSLASAVSEAARDAGYIFASAEVPEQSVKIGVVSVNLDAGSIDEVRVVGSDNRRLKTILNRLVRQHAREDIIERQLLLAGDVPGIRIKATQFERENGLGVLVVTVTENRYRGSARIDNYGPDTLGPYRVRLRYRMADLLGEGDALSVSVTNTLIDPKELSYARIRYARTLGEGSTVVGFSGAYGRTFSGGRLRERDFRGRNRYASVFANHNVIRRNDLNLWLNAELAYRQVLQSREGVDFQDDQIVTANLAFAGNADIGIGRIYGGVGVTQGLGILGASGAGDPMNSRSNADGTFTKANAWVNTLIDIGDTFGLRLAANAQISSDPLLASQEIGLGGAYYGRGYDFSENYGDEGIIGLAELRMGFSDVTDWLDWLQFYSFVDGGYVNHIGSGIGDGSLASAGGGLRARLGKFDLGAEVAKPLTDDRFESDDKSPKVNLNVGVRF